MSLGRPRVFNGNKNYTTLRWCIRQLQQINQLQKIDISYIQGLYPSKTNPKITDYDEKKFNLI